MAERRDVVSYWLKVIHANTDIIEKASRMETEKLFKTYVKQLCEKINSEAYMEQIVKNLKGTPQKLLTYAEVVEVDIPGYAAATMSQAPFICFSVVFLVTFAIMAILLPLELEFISCGPLTRALRSYIPSYDAHIMDSEKRSEIEGKVEKIEADSKAQIKEMEANLKMNIKEAEAELKQKSKEMTVECKQRVKERRERLLAEGGISEEPMLFSSMNFFGGMGKMIKEKVVYTMFFFMAFLHLLQALTNGKFSDWCKKKEQALEVQTAEKETQVSGIIINEEAEDVGWKTGVENDCI
jgi:F0F1-type ATP synthase membrane subunit b/b'